MWNLLRFASIYSLRISTFFFINKILKISNVKDTSWRPCKKRQTLYYEMDGVIYYHSKLCRENYFKLIIVYINLSLSVHCVVCIYICHMCVDLILVIINVKM